jgi:hypothetical protein
VIVIGIGITWLGYAIFMRGYTMVKGYNLSLGDLLSPSDYYKGKWPPPTAPDTVIFPTGKGGGGTASTSSTSSTTTQVGVIPPSKGHVCPDGFDYNPKTGKCDRKTLPIVVH